MKKGRRSWKQISRIKGLTMKQKARLYRGKRGAKRRRRRVKRNYPLRVAYRGKRSTLAQLKRMIGKRKARALFAKRSGRVLYHGKTRLKKANKAYRRGRRSKRYKFHR